jgi:NitT/TauT family transport system ATP-binding protein/nitrate/nitrite transport system substrate-binding protein
LTDQARLRLGFAPLSDAAALIVGRDKGFFAAEGLAVALSREASWATLRDKVAVGALDGAHMLAPLALAMTLGEGCEPTPMIAPFAFNRGGAAVTLSTRLPNSVAEALDGLASLIARRREQGSSRLTFATVFPYSLHNYLLRGWLAGMGVDPDQDVRLIVAPPARTAELLADAVIEGFCAGEPWNQVAERAGVGRAVLRSSRFAPDVPDKVFATTEAWATENRPQALALIRALLRASAWAQAPENQAELIELLARPDAIGVAPEAIAAGLADIRFAGADTNRPGPSDAAWLVEQMQRWNHLASHPEAAAVATRVYRPDLFDAAQASRDA